MTRPIGRRAPLVLQIVGAISLVAVAGLLFGVMGSFPAFGLALLLLAWRYDNHSGSLLMLAILLLIVLAVPILLIMTLVAVHLLVGG